MTLSDDIEKLEIEIEQHALRMGQLSTRLRELRRVLDGSSKLPVPPAPVTQPVPHEPAPTEPIGQPSFKRGYVDPLVWHAAEEEAPKVGCRPETLVAIQVWESDWYTSRLFRTANNVGGIKYRPELPALGHTYGKYDAADGNVYAAFPSWREGVAAHARFLGQRRYDGIRQTDDPAAEVLAIHNAGYAEFSKEWLEGVTALAKRFQKERGS